MTNAFCYLRVSGLSQVQGEGFPRQVEAIQNYAAANDIQIVGIYREEGVSGKNDIEGRPALQAMIADLLSNGTRLVLVEKLDRLARTLIVQETILQDLGRRGITMISVSEPDACSDDPTRTLIRQVLGAFFQFERTMIVSKLADARKRTKAKVGRCEGQPPYGYANLKQDGKLVKLVEVQSEQDVIAFARRLKEQGHRLSVITAALNLAGHRARSGGKFYPMSVKRMLSERRLDPSSDAGG